MALSSKISEELLEVKSHLRNALKFSAMNEKSYISKHIADILYVVDNLEKMEMIADKLENRKPGDNNFFGTFFS